MNLIMTSRRDFNGIIPFYGLVISGIFSLVNQYSPARLFYEWLVDVGDHIEPVLVIDDHLYIYIYYIYI